MNVPGGEATQGLMDATIITATSTVSPTLTGHVTDITLVPKAHVYLPIILRQ